MSDYVSILLGVLAEYNLCDRHPELATYQMLAQVGQLSQSTARAVLMQIQDVLEHYKDFPCHLHRPPTEDQLYVQGKPDIEVGTLVEGDQLRYGLRFLDRPRHVLAVGATGGGKTTLFRRMMIAVEALNDEREQPGDQPDRDRQEA